MTGEAIQRPPPNWAMIYRWLLTEAGLPPWKVNRLTMQQLYWLTKDPEELKRQDSGNLGAASLAFMQAQDEKRRRLEKEGKI